MPSAIGGVLVNTLDTALAYRNMGWSVIPTGEGDPRRAKQPHAAALHSARGSAEWHVYREEPATEAEIRRWYGRYPRAGVAILTGSEVVVVDVERGQAVPPDVIAQPTPHARSENGGHHFFFTPPPGVRVQ